MVAIQSYVKDYLVKPANDLYTEVYTGASDTGLWMGKQVKKLTETNLPKPFAILLQKLFSSIPVAIAYFFLPLPIRLGLWAGYTVVSIATGATNKVVDESLGISMSIELVKVMVSYGISKEAVDLISALFAISAAGFYFHRAKNQ